jgi:transcriptional regulator with XRE-family HTH domain
MKSQVELAKETGILQPHISKYLSGKLIPTYINAKKLSLALNMDTDSFYEMIYERRMARNK